MGVTKTRRAAVSDIEKVLIPCVKEIPSVSPAMAKLLEICDDKDTSAADLSQIVETDPGIAAKVLGIANSALYSPRHRITGVSDAVILLGFDEVKRISLTATVFEKMIKPPKKKHFDRIFFWRHCLCVAILSRTIAEECRYPKPEQAYVCGLLHDMGKIIFDLYGRVNYDGFIAGVARHTGNLISDEKVIMGMGSINIIRPPVLQPEVDKLIDTDHFVFSRLITCMDKEMQAVSRFYNFIFPSPGQFRENMFRANLKLGSINTQYYFMHDTRLPEKEISRLRHSLTTPHRSLDPKTIITTTLEAVYRDFRFDRLYIMRMVKTLRRLRVYEWLDTTDTGMDLRAVEIPINRSAGGFVTCMRNKEPVLITGRTPGEKLALAAFNVTEMVIVPFSSQNKVIGILGMDNIVSQKHILPDTLSAIAIVANELGMAMENAGMYKEAKTASRKDELTGLLNRMAVDELLAKAFRKAVEEKKPLSLVMIDIDYFKHFNDTFGHQAGDNIIKLIATTLKRLSRPFDHVGRYGGEEFIVVLNDTKMSKALVYAERIRREIAYLGRLLAGRFPETALTISAGISEYNKTIRNRDELIARADKALYRAKKNGRNRVEPGQSR